MEQIYHFLEPYLIPILSIHFLILIIFLFLNLKDIKNQFHKIDKKVWAFLLVIFLFGFSLRSESFHSSYVAYYHGGYPFEEYALWLQKTGRMYSHCNFGSYEECFDYEPTNAPPGYPFLIMLSYSIFGFNTLYANYISDLCSSLTIILVFLISYLLTKREEIGLYSAILYAMVPLSIFHASIPNARSVSVFFIALAVLAYLISLKTNKLKSWILFVILFSYSVYIRQENLIMLIVFILGLFIFNFFKDKKIKNIYTSLGKLFSIIVIFVLLQLFVQSLIIYKPIGLREIEPFWGNEIRYFVSYIPSGILKNGAVLFNQYPPEIIEMNAILYNPVVTILFLIGIILLIKSDFRKEKLFIIAWFLVYFLLFSFIYYCEFDMELCSAYLRNSLQFQLPYVILASFALFKIRKSLRVDKNLFILAILIMVFVTSGLHMPTTLFKDSRFLGLEEFVAALKRTPDNCTIISPLLFTARSDVIKNNHRISIQIYRFEEYFDIDKIGKDACIVFLRDENLEDVYSGDYAYIENTFNLKFLFREGSIEVYNATLEIV